MREIDPQGGSGRTAPREHEEKDIRIAAVVLFGVAIALAIFAIHFIIQGVFSTYTAEANRSDRPRSPLREARVQPPEPRLEVSSSRELDRLRREEDERLGSYGWIDRERRIVRIPIERAMDLVARRGLPVRGSLEKGK